MKDEAFFTFKNNKYTLFNIIIFLRFSLYLLQFSTHKNLIYTKMLQMLSAIRRTWPFGSSCSRTRVMSSEASPLFLRSPLIISFLLCLYDHHFYYNPFNALREINVWTKCGAIDCSIWTLWLSWEERTLAPPMFLFLCVSSLLYCPHWMQKQLLFFRGNTRDYGSYSRLYGVRV